jgi:hypothetical protein
MASVSPKHRLRLHHDRGQLSRPQLLLRSRRNLGDVTMLRADQTLLPKAEAADRSVAALLLE